MVLWTKAKKLGIWDPADVDFGRDRSDWLALGDRERETLLHLTTLFVGGEEAVTADLLPLIGVVAAEGRLEEEMYLTSFLWEEAKHVDVFHRFLEEVVVDPGDLGRFHSESYRQLFDVELPGALRRLREDASPVAQARASVTYNLIVEGVLAETGYHAYHAMLKRSGIMPGMLEAIGRLKTDESRHIAYGVHLLTRLVVVHGDGVWSAIQQRMAELLPLAIGVISEIFDAYDEMAFGLELAEFTEVATAQFESRFKRIERAVGV
jgi:ribonucleoside-diphosphate reductase beta chain